MMLFRQRSKTCQSLDEARRNPSAVRSLSLYGPVDAAAFAALIQHIGRTQEICLNWQDWPELPSQLADLKQLRRFRVLNSSIRTFPEHLARCPKLNDLTIRGTDISVIPASVQAFHHLEAFDFTNNPVREIPPELGCLASLKWLQLGELWLEQLPQEMANLRRLRKLALAGNCFSPSEVSRIRSWLPRCRVIAFSVTAEEVSAIRDWLRKGQ